MQRKASVWRLQKQELPGGLWTPEETLSYSLSCIVPGAWGRILSIMPHVYPQITSGVLRLSALLYEKAFWEIRAGESAGAGEKIGVVVIRRAGHVPKIGYGQKHPHFSIGIHRKATQQIGTD